jgi:hypothetical protein
LQKLLLKGQSTQIIEWPESDSIWKVLVHEAASMFTVLS